MTRGRRGVRPPTTRACRERNPPHPGRLDKPSRSSPASPPAALRWAATLPSCRPRRTKIVATLGPASSTPPGRGTVHWVAFLDEVEGWLPHEVERLYAIAENLSTHRATDVLPLMLAHPRWEMVFQPKYAAYLNLIEPWWEVLRSLALAGRRFETWDEVTEAIAQATEYSDAHRHHSSGDSGAGIARADGPASHSCPGPHDLPDEPRRGHVSCAICHAGPRGAG